MNKKKANPNFLFLKDRVPKQRFTLLQGGTRSGKTFATIYYFIWLCENYTGLEIDICRDTFTALKSTVWKDFKQVLLKHNLYNPLNHNKTDKQYNLNGNIISYYGADDPGKIHGRSRDILWLNEANQLDQETIDQLFPRTRHRIVMDYNPALPVEHWLDPYIDEFPPLKTTYLDNPYLTEDQIADIERKKNDPYWWSVYGSGERAKPVGVIFDNWTEGEFDDSLPYIWAMDFGMTDPTTLVKIATKKNKLYVKEYLYKSGLSPSEIIAILEKTVNKSKDFIVADSAEPLTIREIRLAGFNVDKSPKGRDSVRNGIFKIKDYDMIVDPDSHNLKKELFNYVWAEKKSETPVDAWNHLIDPIRYGLQILDKRNSFFVL